MIPSASGEAAASGEEDKKIRIPRWVQAIKVRKMMKLPGPASQQHCCLVQSSLHQGILGGKIVPDCTRKK